jgi:hypothetical protein
MREILNPLDPVKLETELGAVYVAPIGNQALRVHAPHLTVDGVPLQFSAHLTAGPDLLNWDFIHMFDSRTEQSGIAPHAISARLVDGRDADLVTLGRIAQVLLPAVRKLATTNQALFLEAQRRQLNNEIRALEEEVERDRLKIEEKVRAIAKITERLP